MLCSQVMAGGTALILGMSAVGGELTSFDRWLERESHLAAERLAENISPPDTKPGAIVAATSRTAPEYYSHWVRDGGLVMLELVSEYAEASEAGKTILMQKMIDHVEFSRHVQTLDNPAGKAYENGLGEVRFNVDGTPYLKDWGRPQNDGPALRALSMIKIYGIIEKSTMPPLDKGNLLAKLYDPIITRRSVIKTDLEYIAHHWREACVDLWEEVRGGHFYTKMSIRAALKEGANFASQRGDFGAAEFYLDQLKAIDADLQRHRSDHAQKIWPTVDWQGDRRGKHSDLDIAVLLAVNQVGDNSQHFGALDPLVASSATMLLKSMNEIYPINRRRHDFENGVLAPAVGRYPEDVYNGTGFGVANPWFLTTLAYAEWVSNIAIAAQQETIAVSPQLSEFFDFFGMHVAAGETIDQEVQELLLEIARRFFRRVRLHSDPRDVNDPAFSGRLSEQFDLEGGYMRGAENLTWSYAAFGSAQRAYAKALKGLKSL